MVKGKPITVRSSEYLGVVSVYLPEIILKAEMSKNNLGEGRTQSPDRLLMHCVTVTRTVLFDWIHPQVKFNLQLSV